MPVPDLDARAMMKQAGEMAHEAVRMERTVYDRLTMDVISICRLLQEFGWVADCRISFFNDRGLKEEAIKEGHYLTVDYDTKQPANE